MEPEVKNEFQEVYQEIDGLKERISKLEACCPSDPICRAPRPELEAQHPGNKRLDNRIFAEGHPIPEYNEKQCEVLFKAVFKNADKIRTAEMNLIDCVYDFLDHRDTYPAQSYGFDQELRAWGEQDYKNYRAIEEAAEALSDL